MISQQAATVLGIFLDNASVFRVVNARKYAGLIDPKKLSCTARQRQEIDRYDAPALFGPFRALLGCFLDGAGHEDEDAAVRRQARVVFAGRYSQDLLNAYAHLNSKIGPIDYEDATPYERRTDEWDAAYRNLSVFDRDNTLALKKIMVSPEERYSPAYKALCYLNLLKYRTREELLPRSAYRTRRAPYGPILPQRRSFRSTPY